MEERLLKDAINEIKNLKHGESFALKDLFRGYSWNRLSVVIRAKLGKLFSKEVSNRDDITVVNNLYSGKQQIYQKI